MDKFQPNMALFLFIPLKRCVRSLVIQFDSSTLWDGFVVIRKEMAWIVLEDAFNFQIFTQVLACFVLDAVIASISPGHSRLCSSNSSFHIKDR